MSSFIFIGPPGAGKGTQKEKILEKYKNIGIISPGDLMREEINKGTQKGLILKEYINIGKLAPHKIVMEIVEEKIKYYKNKDINFILFDGFPREIDQAEALDILLKKEEYKKYEIKCVFLFKVEDEEVIKRIYNRSKTSNREDDKDEKIIKDRLKIYYSNIKNILKKYENITYEINASLNINDVFQKIDSVISNFI